MYAKFFAIAALVSVAAAGAIPPSVSQCNVGTMQCCNQVQKASDESTKNAVSTFHGAGLLGAVGLESILDDLTAEVGINCTPVDVIGLGSNSCSAQPTCCSGNNFNGLIVVGCSPINAGL